MEAPRSCAKRRPDMAKNLCLLTFLAILAGALILGCGEQGKVDQGRAVATDNAKKTVTIILDVKHELGKPAYDKLPPVTFAFPDDPQEMGPEPKAGKLMSVNPDKKEIVIYDDAAKNFKTIVYTPIQVKKGVGLRDPLVSDKKFPIVDREKKTITVYDKRNRLVTTFSLPEEYFQMPDNTFGFGDEVRIYSKTPGKATRLMNISETDIYKK
jgi:hypothetical protein